MDQDTFLGLMLVISILMLPIIWATTAKNLKKRGMGFIKRHASGGLASTIGSLGIFVAACIYSEKLPKSSEPVAVESGNPEAQQEATEKPQEADQQQVETSETPASVAEESKASEKTASSETKENSESDFLTPALLLKGAVYAVSEKDLFDACASVKKMSEEESNDRTSVQYTTENSVRFLEMQMKGLAFLNNENRKIQLTGSGFLFTTAKFKFPDRDQEYHVNYNAYVLQK